ncbi:MAG: C2H2-type zinc finger protein [Thermoproteota archaeon]|nr:C2H2-type zinc finger protein [Thermoproteota archaeon]
MAAKQEKEEEKGKKIKVDGTEVKVKTPPPPQKARPVYYCQTCDKSFSSQLDLEEHMKIDHNNSNEKER